MASRGKGKVAKNLMWGLVVVTLLVLMGVSECHRVHTAIHGYELKEF